MKSNIRFYLAAAALMLILPAAVLLHRAPEPETPASGSYTVLQCASGDIAEISARDYLIGAVAAEMPALYPAEALKAQAVLCHTYIERIRLQNAQSPKASLMGADISDDPAAYQGYYTPAQMRQAYGARYDEYAQKIADAVDAVGGLMLVYGGEPIVAAYHAVSPGKTESSENVWGSALPYLVPVASDWDRRRAPETVSLTPQSVRRALTQAMPALSLPDDPAKWFSTAQTSESGTVLQISCGGQTLSGQTVRQALALPSAAFTVTADAEHVEFTVSGAGHGVGMSQYGAGEMARRGSDYKAILAHYYPNTELR